MVPELSDHAGTASVTAPIFRARYPTLLPFTAVKCRLSQLDIDIVVCLAHPVSQFTSTPRLGRALGDVPLEIFRAYPAGVQLREELDERHDVRLLRRCRFIRICSGDGV